MAHLLILAPRSAATDRDTREALGNSAAQIQWLNKRAAISATGSRA